MVNMVTLLDRVKHAIKSIRMVYTATVDRFVRGAYIRKPCSRVRDLMSDEAEKAGQFPRDIDDLYAPGARMMPRAKTPARVEDSPGFKPSSNDRTVNLATAYLRHADDVMAATRPLREALIDRLRRNPLKP